MTTVNSPCFAIHCPDGHTTDGAVSVCRRMVTVDGVECTYIPCPPPVVNQCHPTKPVACSLCTTGGL